MLADLLIGRSAPWGGWHLKVGQQMIGVSLVYPNRQTPLPATTTLPKRVESKG